MDYRKTAQEILGYVGGSKNIVSAAHCATRLRLVIADNSKADKEAIENVDGVKGVFEASGQLSGRWNCTDRYSAYRRASEIFKRIKGSGCGCGTGDGNGKLYLS